MFVSNHLYSLNDQFISIYTNTIRIGSTVTTLYFDLYFYSAYAAHNVPQGLELVT